MNWSARLKHGKDLEERVKYDVRRLARYNPRGFVIRLHILGDFYSVAYVRLWRSMLALYPGLRIFGYTAHSRYSEMGHEIYMLNSYNNRCVIRFSNGAYNVKPRTMTIDDSAEVDSTTSSWNKPIICPAQTGKTDCCGTCALCWAVPDKTIAFLRH